jgi:hypothetical protein
MPQFDRITFFTQIFWLILTFFGSYFLILQIFLPKLAAVIKSRKKKLSLSSIVVFNLNKEQLLVNSDRNIFLQDFTEKTKTKLNLKLLLSIIWLTGSLSESIKMHLKISQYKYLESYQNALVKYHASFKMLENYLISKP